MAFGSKNSTPSFVLTLPMVISLNEQDLLYKEFKKCGIIYNQLVCITTKMWHQLRKTRKYRELMADIAKAAPDSDEQKALLKQREKMLKEYRFSENAFHAMVVPYAKHYALHSHVAQMVATAVWAAWSSFFFDNGKEVHYKKLEQVFSISGKNNTTGIMLRPANHTTSVINSAKKKIKGSIEEKYFAAYRKPDAKEGEEVVLPDEVKTQMEKEIAAATAKVKTSIGKGELRLVYGDYTFPLTLRNPDTQAGWYQQEALKCGVKYCRIIRKWVGIKWKYYAQIVLEGYPPIKCDSNGVAKRSVKQGRVGIDIGTQTIAFSCKDVCDLRVLAPSARAQAKSLVNEIATTLRAMNRSRRATNPKYYNTAAVENFQKFQANVPLVSFTTQQMVQSADKGIVDGVVMEYQSYQNDPTLQRNYEFIPFGVRHDNPLYSIGNVSAEKKEVIAAFVSFCAQNQAEATKDGFNGLDDYVYSQSSFLEKDRHSSWVSVLFLLEVFADYLFLVMREHSCIVVHHDTVIIIDFLPKKRDVHAALMRKSLFCCKYSKASFIHIPAANAALEHLLYMFQPWVQR